MLPLSFRSWNHSAAKPTICVAIPFCDGAENLSVLEQIEAASKDYLLQVVVFNDTDKEATETRSFLRKHGWHYYKLEGPLSENEYQKEMFTILRKHTVAHYLIIPSDAQLTSKFLSVAMASWNSFTDPKKGVLSFCQNLPVIKQSGPTTPEQVSDIGDAYILPQTTLEVLSKWDASGSMATYLSSKGIHLYQTKQVKVVRNRKEVPVVEVLPMETKVESIAKKAIFLTATRDRPVLLEATLTSLMRQKIPEGWTIECVVTGHPNDTGKEVALRKGATYIDVESMILTDKLNYCVKFTDAELVMMADDDDIQPDTRAWASIRAYEKGASWSGTGSIYYFDVETGRVIKWEGAAGKGMIGTSLTYTTKLLRKVGGWPTRSQGKDGPLASRILKLGREVQFADITTDMPLIVSMQHKANIWKRPALEKGQTGKQGSFVLTGLGHFDEVPEISSETKNLLSYVQEGQLISVVTAQPSPKEVTPEVILPTTFTGELWTSVSGGHGTLAYADGLKVLGFRQVAFKESELKLAKGIPVLYHGWRNDLKVWGKKYPGKVVVLWHSGWTGSDIMGEGQALAEVIECAVQGIIKLLWLEQRDVLPPNAIQAYPVWDPEAMSKIADPRPAKIPNNVVVGLHNDWAALCKNSLAAIAGCSQVPNIKIHTSVPAMRGARGLTAQKLLKNVNHEIHPMMSKKDAINLVASCDLLVHPSVSDTWPYLVMESIYNGTPVVVSGTIAWAKDLSKWAQDKCLIQANCSSKSISQKVKELIEDEESLTRLLKEQKICLDSLAKHYQNKMIETLNKVNFNIKKPASLFTPDTLHLLIDSPNWAFDRIATQIQRHSKYDVQKHYICEHETIKEGVVFWWRGYHKYVEHPEKSMVCIYDFLSWDEQTVIDIFSKFKVIGVANELLYEKLIKFPVLQNKPMFILRDGVDTDMFTCVSMIKNTNKLQVGWVGNSAWGDDSDFKGFKILQEVQKKTKAFCDWHIADKKQGGTPFEDMPNYYKKLDVITCFSKAEGTPNPALEGASSGCFVLSTQVGLVPEMEKTGCVVKTLDRDVDSFVKFLKKLYQNNTLIKEARKINPQIMKKEWDWKVRIKDWQKALECLKTEPTEIIADLSDVVTVFVTTVGAPDFPHCLDCLNKQDVKFQLKVICNVAPMSAAFQKMIDDCTTEYYIQIDEDMLLYPHAIRTLYEKMKQQDKKVGVFFMGLHDVFTDFCLVGVKIYRHAVMKQFPYLKTDFSCEVDQIARMQKEHYRIEGETPGLHGQKELCVGDLNAFWTKWGVFEKYSRDMQKYRLYPQKQSWMKELPSLFIKKIQEGDELAIFALGGAIVGLTSSLQVSGEKDFTNPTFKHLFEDLNRIFTKRETQ